MKYFLSWVCISMAVYLSGQQEIISTTTDFIVAHKYSEADQYLDSVLKKNPKSVDVLMMKGNVILNHTLDTTQPMQFITDEDESIFSSAISEKPKLLSRNAVLQIEKYWRTCLKIDSSRVDIRKGLCSVYAMALMKDSLKNEVVQLKKVETDDGEQAYRIAEYARKLKERNQFDDAMELYQFIAKQYPELAGIRCDIASEYFYRGNIKEALAWLDSTFSFKSVDETSFLNGAFIYSELGYFDNAQTVLNTHSNIYQRKMDMFYSGLRLFADLSDEYFDVLNGFCNLVDSNSYFTEITLARKLLAFRDSFSLANYIALIEDKEIPDYYKVLVHTRAIRQLASYCEPFLNYGVFQSSFKNYSLALQFLEDGEPCKNNPEKTEYRMLHYGYALIRSGEIEKSLEHFRQLINSSNGLTRHAATYFTAKILVAQGKKKEAMNFKMRLELSSHVSKYLYLLWAIKAE